MPHEITHMVTHEFFGAQNLPRWLDEGMSRRSEQTRKHYEEASKTGRETRWLESTFVLENYSNWSGIPVGISVIGGFTNKVQP